MESVDSNNNKLDGRQLCHSKTGKPHPVAEIVEESEECSSYIICDAIVKFKSKSIIEESEDQLQIVVDSSKGFVSL